MSLFPGYYILKNGKPVHEPDVLKWAAWFEMHDHTRIVERTTIRRNDVEIVISTVFLGINHSWGVSKKPILWETMVFNGPSDQYQVRYTSLAAAKKGHAKVVKQEQRIQAQHKKDK